MKKILLAVFFTLLSNLALAENAYQSKTGILTIARACSAISFSLSTVARNGHSCLVEGVAKTASDNKAVWGKNNCHIIFLFQKNNIHIKAEGCASFCGVNAESSMSGVFSLMSPKKLYAFWEEKLRRVYMEIMPTLSVQGQLNLKTEQRTWLTEREKNCKSLTHPDKNLSCRANMTRQRTETLISRHSI